jgi:hypothetical protein
MRFRRTKTYRKKAARPPPSPNHHHQQRRTASLSCSFWVNTCKRGMNQHIENSALPNSFLQWVQMPSTTDEPQKNRSRRRSFPYLTHVVCLSPRDPWSLSVVLVGHHPQHHGAHRSKTEILLMSSKTTGPNETWIIAKPPLLRRHAGRILITLSGTLLYDIILCRGMLLLLVDQRHNNYPS